MTIQISGVRFNLTMSDDHILSVQNAVDREHIGTLVDRIWTKISDWFCGTNRTEAKKLLFDLFSPMTDDDTKFESFHRLKGLVSPVYQDKFLETSVPGEYRVNLSLDLGIESTSINFSVDKFLCTLNKWKKEGVLEVLEEDRNDRNHVFDLIKKAYDNKLLTLDLSYCLSLTKLPEHFPAFLTSLSLGYCELLTTLPEHLPASLTKLRLGWCRSLTALPEHLPASLTELNLEGCESLTALPEHLPASLTELDLAGCRSLTALPEHLPASLTELYLEGCESLTTLPVHLPPNLQIFGRAVPHTPPQKIWYQRAGKTEADIATLKQQWKHVETTPHAASFEALLQRLNEGKLKNSVTPAHVVEIIDEIIQSEETRTLIFDATQSADQDCHDRPLTIFNTVQSLARFSKLQRENAPVADILNLAEGMLKVALLDEVTLEVMNQQWKQGRRSTNKEGTGPNVNEALEVQLGLRYALGGTLNLPFKVQKPLYTAMAGLTEKDQEFAINYVNATMNNPDKKREGLVEQCMWATYLSSILAAEIENIKSIYAKTIENYDVANRKGFIREEQEYMTQISRLMIHRDDEIRGLLIEETSQILSRTMTVAQYVYE